jgi:DNA-binding NtrC family response regulator
VLIVDDEEAIRIIAARILEQSGFSVLVASDSQSALALFRANSAEIACVLLDLTMPQIGGDTVLEVIRGIKPEARVILMSGYDEQEVTNRFVNQRPNGFLQKPFSPEQLRETMRGVLEQS